MTIAERDELVAYKMLRAKETLEEVELQIENKLFHTAINRLYYAGFYAVSALLINENITARKHSGVKQMFGLHFILPGRIDSDLGDYYTYIFEKRQKSDYEDFIYLTENEVTVLLDPARKLFNRITEILYPNSAP